jgi:hypothetical protein
MVQKQTKRAKHVARAWFVWFVFALGEDSNDQNFREVELSWLTTAPLSAQFGLWSFRINFRNSSDSMRARD